ncbi:MAG: FKBP-type peptidyl-prolyl cis-trans isomerase [Prevotellaceae bacterium]|jgi:FKBP-type peptidyl-prolyl cis-trans isomerase FklB|nr:FKBP-type peptidyl-prolyl cis-trans isomerase [Prevotellaceae bacterium]
MKQIVILLSTALLFTTMSCAQNANKNQQSETTQQNAPQQDVANDEKEASYAFGVDVGNSLKNYNIEGFDVDKFIEGFKAIYNDDGKIDIEANRAVIQNFMTAMQTKKNEKNQSEGTAFLEKNKTEEGVITTESGLQYKIEKAGTGAYPTAESEVEVNYRGTLIDGREFDSSYKRNETVKFPLNRVIKGWTEGIQKINEGGKIKLFVPYDLAYGERGAQGSIIEPYATLIFEVELIKIVK